jgi:hypothetical protein
MLLAHLGFAVWTGVTRDTGPKRASKRGIENFLTQIFAAACPRAKHERQAVALFEIVLEQETADGGVAA